MFFNHKALMECPARFKSVSVNGFWYFDTSTTENSGQRPLFQISFAEIIRLSPCPRCVLRLVHLLEEASITQRCVYMRLLAVVSLPNCLHEHTIPFLQALICAGTASAACAPSNAINLPGGKVAQHVKACWLNTK